MPGWRNWLDARDLKSLEDNLIRVRVPAPASMHAKHLRFSARSTRDGGVTDSVTALAKGRAPGGEGRHR